MKRGKSDRQRLLTRKQLRFVEAYIDCRGNGTQAAMEKLRIAIKCFIVSLLKTKTVQVQAQAERPFRSRHWDRRPIVPKNKWTSKLAPLLGAWKLRKHCGWQGHAD